MKEPIIKILKKALKEKEIKLKEEEIENLLEIPPSIEMGDYAFPCFFLEEKLKQEPHQIALEIREKIGNVSAMDFEDIQTNGPYVNFFVDRKELARKVVWDIITKKQKYGKSKIGRNKFGFRKKVVVEFSSPNIAKPFGIGHLRSTIIGNSIANICEFVGFKPKRINYLGDWGAQFGKLIYGYNKFGEQDKLQKDPIKYLLEIYVKVNKYKKYQEPSRKWFKKLEEGDEKAVMLWKAFKELSLEEFQKIYDFFDIKFNDYSGESMQSKEEKKAVMEELKEKKLLKKSKGAWIVNLEEYNLGVCLIQKSDGTSLYATRDLAEAIKRHEKYKFAKMIYEVGQEQKLHFKQIFKILELMGYDWAKNCIHVSHGFYLDKDGKKFTTRKGKTIFMEDIINKTVSLAKKEIKKRFPKLIETELERRARKVAISAIFYGDLKSNRTHNIIFNIEKFVSFEGDTGPYILYSYARASSILKKSKNPGEFMVHDLESEELELVKKLSQFQKIVSDAYEHLSPSLIANYSYQLAQIFNVFYHSCPVIGSKQDAFRLALVESFRYVIRSSMSLLGIDLLEEM